MRGGEVRVARRCDVAWSAMSPVADGVRHCASCDRRVYDLTGRTPSEVRALWVAHEGALCAMVTVRPDGTVAAGGGADCPDDLEVVRGGLTG